MREVEINTNVSKTDAVRSSSERCQKSPNTSDSSFDSEPYSIQNKYKSCRSTISTNLSRSRSKFMPTFIRSHLDVSSQKRKFADVISGSSNSGTTTHTTKSCKFDKKSVLSGQQQPGDVRRPNGQAQWHQQRHSHPKCQHDLHGAPRHGQLDVNKQPGHCDKQVRLYEVITSATDTWHLALSARREQVRSYKRAHSIDQALQRAQPPIWAFIITCMPEYLNPLTPEAITFANNHARDMAVLQRGLQNGPLCSCKTST